MLLFLAFWYHYFSVSQPSFTCSNNKQWVLTAPAGYITNAVVMDTNCGSMTSPLMIRALPGQKINLTLYNFDPILPQSHRQYNEPETGCDTYAHVIDKAAERSVPVCRGGARLGHVYVSANRSLELVLYKTRSDGYQHGPFVLYYEGRLWYACKTNNTATNLQRRIGCRTRILIQKHAHLDTRALTNHPNLVLFIYGYIWQRICTHWSDITRLSMKSCFSSFNPLMNLPLVVFMIRDSLWHSGVSHY